MDETQDQVQEDSQVGPETIKAVPDQAPDEQSETTEEVAEAKEQLFKDHLGRELTAEQLQEEYVKTQSYITRLEGEKKQWEESAQQEASKAVSENTLLKDVDPNVRDAIVEIVTPVIEDSLKQRDAQAQQEAQNKAFEVKIAEAKETFPGGDGMPKFDEIKVMAAMKEPGNEIFDPKFKWMEMNMQAYMDRESKKALKGKSSGTKTEDTRGSTPRKPKAKSPNSWDEASKSAMSR